ncbi:MAG: Gfo/Idh/MocA family oxidoreductase, partial [Candidatus Limnocylindrales bacterium]
MNELRWGILSTADIARTKVIPGIRGADRCRIVAIASRDLARAQAAAAEAGIPTVHGSYEALLADPDVDAVYIPLPNHLHAEWAIAAARAGKHVLCEKPLAMTAADAQRMVDVAEAEGVRLMEAFMYRLHPSWVAVVDLVRSGRIGRLVAVQSWFSYFNDDPTNIRNIREA